jgi:hypothetical protein
VTTNLRYERGFDDFMRDNKVPLALIGIGAALLLVGNTGLADRVVNDERLQAVRRRSGELAGNMGSGDGTGDPRGGSILGPDGKPLSPAGGDHEDSWVHQAAGAARNAITSVRDAGGAVLDRARSASDFTGRASNQVIDKLATDPWLIGVAGLVAGAVLAAVIPPTRIEQDYIGEARDNLLNRAQELGHEAAERVRELADTATGTAAH